MSKTLLNWVSFSLFLFGAIFVSQAQLPKTCASHDHMKLMENNEPGFRENIERIESNSKNWELNRSSSRVSNTVITIPVVFHVLYNNPTENISDAQILSQIVALNKDFRKLNPDTTLIPNLFKSLASDSYVEFCLAKRNPQGLPTNGITRTYTNKTVFYHNSTEEMKYTSLGGEDVWDRNQYLNIWICNLGGGVLGYAQFPGGSAYSDGVVVHYNCVGTIGNVQYPYDKGRVLSHEIGHWLNLRHIWGDASCGNDFVNDTPTQATSNYNCPSFPHPSCGNTSDMYMNFMDYVNNECMLMFSQGQASRMMATINTARASLLASLGCTDPSVFCTGTTPLTATTGNFSDGSGASNYKDNSDCQWLIQPLNAATIQLTFNSFSTEPGNDQVIVYDGPTTSSTVIGTFSGNSIPAVLNSSGGTLLVRFLTNGSTTQSGWDASYIATLQNSYCSGTITYTPSSGTITDGSGTGNYGNNADCKFFISPAGAQNIQITFNNFDTESNKDFLKIYNGTTTTSNLIGVYSGNALPSSININASNVLLWFTSDGATTNQGWSLSYTSSTTPNTNFCSGTTTMTSPTGTISDGSGNSNYQGLSDCRFLIQPPGASNVTLHFNDFTTESAFDLVRIYDGNTIGATVIGTYSGSSLPSDITSTGSSMLVRFTSDPSNNLAGWSASYSANLIAQGNACLGQGTKTAASGTITDGSGASNYADNLDCRFLIQPTNASTITLNFTAFDTEYNFDFVNVYDGEFTSSPLLGSFSGNSLPTSIVSSGGSMLVQFISDAGVSATGWSASYSSTTAIIGSCAPLTNYTNATGIVSDGSGVLNYANNSNCSYQITIASGKVVQIDFTEFNTELSYDFLNFYDGTSNNGSLIGSFTGSALPASFNSSTNNVFIEFITNGFTTASGWSFNYSSVVAGENTGSNAMQQFIVAPNPTSNNIRISGTSEAGGAHLQLCNTIGEVITENMYTDKNIDLSLDVSFLQSGIYYLKIILKDQIYTYKISKQ